MDGAAASTPVTPAARDGAGRRRGVLLLAAMAAVLSLVLGADSAVFWRYMTPDGALSFERVVVAPVTRALLWTALAPFVVWFTRRVPLHAPRLAAAVLAHLSVAVALGTLAVTAYAELLLGHGPHEPGWHWTLIWVPEWVPLQLAIAGATQAYDSQRHAAARERQAAELRAQLVEAQLAALRQQLHPHFVFNTLQAVSTLMYRDVGAADALLARLSHVLRRLLELVDRRQIPLAEELAFVESYLAIERARLGDRIEVGVDVDRALLGCAVPPLLLQPLVENAVKHAVLPRSGGRVDVAARRDRGLLVLEVRDDGPGLGPGFGPDDHGTGLRTTEGRLRALGRQECRLTLENASPRGLVARVTIPFVGAEGA